MFSEAGLTIPDDIRIAIGWTQGKKAIGECWKPDNSKDGTVEIFIIPSLDDELEIAAILAHELIHSTGIFNHGKNFKAAMVAIGLEGKPTATKPSEAFKRKWREISAGMEHLPHASLTKSTKAHKPQTARMLKAVCIDCGYVVRLARKWAESHGAHCPQHGAMFCDVGGNEEEVGELEDV
jgi:hypothetical protein